MPDFAKINYFRIYFFTDGENLVALDYVGFGGEDEDFSSLATELGEVQREEHIPEAIRQADAILPPSAVRLFRRRGNVPWRQGVTGHDADIRHTRRPSAPDNGRVLAG